MVQHGTQIFIGIGGWEHGVLDRCLYPTTVTSPAEKLGYYARVFNTVEVRPTFWDETLGAREAEEWADAVGERRDFLFSVKLHFSLTHKREPAPGVLQNTRALLDTLQHLNRLGAVLAQFPFSFTCTGANRFHLERLATTFRDYPLHIELRHASWDQPSLPGMLEEWGAAPVQADLPRIRQLMNSLPRSRGDRAYLRLHGRNERGWLGETYDARYDYLYNHRELHEIKRRLQALPLTCSQKFVIWNNTTSGKAVANALQLSALMNDRGTCSVPAPALREFPFLQQIARPEASGTSLFDGYREAM
jgi:uncharacterized protein YecE (DUF72 family)